MIRDAKAVDIPAIVSLLEDAYARTHYAKSGLTRIDPQETKRLLMTGIMRHGHKNGGGCFVQVAESHGIVTGLIFGTLARVYSIGDRLMATDLFWIASPLVDPRDPRGLMKNMLAWAESAPHVIEATCAATAIINIDPEEAGRILESLGMKRYGILYRTEFAQ